MLSLLFKESLTEEQNTQLFYEFQEYPQKYEHYIPDIHTKLSVYVGDRKLAQQMADKLKHEGFKFITQIHQGKPFFHDDFLSISEQTESKCLDSITDTAADMSNNFQTPIFAHPTATPVSRMERKPTVRFPSIRNDLNQLLNPLPEPSPPVPSSQQYVTMEHFEELSRKAKDQLNEFSINLMSKVEALTASASRTGIVHDHSGYTIPAPSPAAPVAEMRPPPVMAQYKAKNELIANGIRCEKCNKTVKDVEPITKLIMSVRDHVMSHFDSENPLLKRLSCRDCPDYRTNFVDDFEKHLKRHGSMTSITEKRQKLTENLLTETYLKELSQLSNQCFPEVFENAPPSINTIMAVDTPLKAKISVFPRLDRLYCSKFNIPYASTGRASLPAPLIRID
ncbi:hypothetical protein GCK72_001301 [Caenorhabditis remanei]|uniref:Uncharacterized protein n=1 Tax=Caenorhabditis remanei TaxID=31234 RepID=A0A6A5HS63_CAERE|nr:hypothetical protein GCK72_001301 [Caenorhabditis remanei]KAF1769484.1 hypothetical protein GCK72_001301 [Caenorhabditis remanei]